MLTFATLLAFGALVYLAFALGRELFSPWVGVVAALVVLTRPAMERDALLAYQDVPFAALVVGAVLLEARRPRARRRRCSRCSRVAGLLRPEAWVLAGLYVLWIWAGRTTAPARRRRRAGRGRAADLGRPRTGPSPATRCTPCTAPPTSRSPTTAAAPSRDVPYWTAQYFGYALREPLVLGVPIGLAFAWFHARRRAVLPLAVVAAMVAVFAIGPIFGLPLIRRYVATPAVLLSLFYGLAVAGWAMLPHGPARTRWLAAGVVAALLSVAYLPWHVRPALDGRAPPGPRRRALRRPPAGDGGARGQRRVRRLPGPHGRRPPPDARTRASGSTARPASVSTVEGGASPMGKLLLMPVKGPTTSRIYPPKVFPKVEARRAARTVYENRSWRVSAAPGCR